mmetsp:Transcript_44576/g.105660  ORF Transcript_44576/g.105660 Transcript_44576/m.105660 type:complete len:909 (+) Transcript_44576:126-2852(+)
MTWTVTPHQIGTASLLLQYVEGDRRPQGQQRIFEFLIAEIVTSSGLTSKSISEVQRQWAQRHDGDVWCAYVACLRKIDSPEALFSLVESLEAALTRDPAASALIQATSFFGQFVRSVILSFRQASFEQVVALSHSIQQLASPPLAGAAESSNSPEDSAQKAQSLQGTLGISHHEVDGHAQDLSDERSTSSPQLQHFLRYAMSSEHRIADTAVSSLRAFHDGRRGHAMRDLLGFGLKSLLGLAPPEPDDGSALQDMVQYAAFGVAGVHMRCGQVDTALNAIGESIRAAQFSSDNSCLCSCLYFLSTLLLHSNHGGRAHMMLTRCLRQGEELGLVLPQALSCLALSRLQASQLALPELPSMAAASRRRPLTLTRRERAAAGGVAHAVGGRGPATSAISAAQAIMGGAAGAGQQGAMANAVRPLVPPAAAANHMALAAGGSAHQQAGSSVLGALLQAGSEGGSAGSCHSSLAHIVAASILAAQTVGDEAIRAKVLLTQAEVSRIFGMPYLIPISCDLAVRSLVGSGSGSGFMEERLLASCQQATALAAESVTKAAPLWLDITRSYPHALRTWGSSIGEDVVAVLCRMGEHTAAEAVVFQVAGVAEAAETSLADGLKPHFSAVANLARIHSGHLLAAYTSATQAIDGVHAVLPDDACRQLVLMTDLHLEANDPVSALGPCMRCLAAATHGSFQGLKAQALVRLARVKLELGELAEALLLAEDIAPQVLSTRSSVLHAELLLVQAEILLAVAAARQSEASRTTDQLASAVNCNHIFREAVPLLSAAVDLFGEVLALKCVAKCHYLLARLHHQLGNVSLRNRHASCCRAVSQGDLPTTRAASSRGSNSQPSPSETSTCKSPALKSVRSLALAARGRAQGEETCRNARTERGSGDALVSSRTGLQLFPLTAILGG